ncbi:MAG: MaoC/PaaZ C-terminal domain-containing protein [Smithella sp.]|nr:MaoC/PaaZ C-terminal domain-containing protein [Smithella sp.]
MIVDYNDIEIGDEMPPYISAPITRTHLVRYAGASGDFNPLHHDQTFVKMIGMKNVIAHGMLIMGIVGEAITSWIENKYLRKFNARFMSMTEPVDWDNVENTKDRATIIVSGKVVKKFEENGEKKFECEIIAEDALGSKKLSGFFIAALP